MVPLFVYALISLAIAIGVIELLLSVVDLRVDLCIVRCAIAPILLASDLNH